MSATEILALVGQGLALLPTLIQTGIDVTTRIEQLAGISTAAANGTLTDVQLQSYRTQLDQDLADFNADLPPSTKT